MEFQKYSHAATPDPAKANQAFMATVTTKFTKEAYHTLRRYMETMPEIKDVVNLQLRAQKITDAGVTMARQAFETQRDMRDKQSILAEASRIFGMGKESAFQKACTFCLIALTSPTTFDGAVDDDDDEDSVPDSEPSS